MKRPNEAFALAWRYRACQAVLAAMDRNGGLPVGVRDLEPDFAHWSRARVGRLFTAIAALPPDNTGRRLVHCGRRGGVNVWTVAYG